MDHRDIPALGHLTHLLAFCDFAPSVEVYERIAEQREIAVLRDRYADGYRLLKSGSFRLMLVDGQLARMHVAGFFPAEANEAERADGRAVGVETVKSAEEITEVYRTLLEALMMRIGAPTGRGSTADELNYGFVDDESDEEKVEPFDYPFAFWRRKEAILVLLATEGDMQIDEWAAVDIRIAPCSAEDGLPGSVEEPFGWPTDP